MMQPFKKLLMSLCVLMIIPTASYAVSKQGRLGVGVNDQLINSLPALSLKLQQSRSFAIGGLAGVSTKEAGGGYGLGLKVYKIIFEEPQLNFYASAMVALLNEKTSSSVSETGFQCDLTFGPEFHFQGLESIGFSFEFGISMNKLGEFAFETVGNHFIVAGVHFYL